MLLELKQRVKDLEKEVHDLQLKNLPSMKSILCTEPYQNPYDCAQPIPYKCEYSNYWNKEWGWLCPAHNELNEKIKKLKI